LPRRKKENWAELAVWVTLIITLLAIAVNIIFSNADKTDKYFGLLVLAFIGYIIYNEIQRRKIIWKLS